MCTGTNDKNEIGKIVQEYIDQGYTIITVTKDSYGQWIISAGV